MACASTRRRWPAACKVTGATVHFVNESPRRRAHPRCRRPWTSCRGDTPEVLQKRVMEQAEWKLLPQAVRLICDGKFSERISAAGGKGASRKENIMEQIDLNRRSGRQRAIPAAASSVGNSAGRPPDRSSAYFIMGRSENSRNRVFAADRRSGIRTEAFDPRKMEDPSLIIYAPGAGPGRDA